MPARPSSGRVTLGKGATIGGNVWITDDVPPGASVTQASLQNAPQRRAAIGLFWKRSCAPHNCTSQPVPKELS